MNPETSVTPSAGPEEADGKPVLPEGFRKRFVLAALLGHLLASYVFIFVLLFGAGLRQLWSEVPNENMPLPDLLAEFLWLPVSSAPIALLATVVVAPWSLIGVSVAYGIAKRRKVGRWATIDLGALMGGLLAGVMLLNVSDNDGVAQLRTAWETAVGFAAAAEVSALIAGACYAWVIWHMAMRPYPRLEPIDLAASA